jgi:hypothetical protein
MIHRAVRSTSFAQPIANCSLFGSEKPKGHKVAGSKQKRGVDDASRQSV